MDNKVQNNIIDYFKFLENVYTTFKSTLLECFKIAMKLRMMSERYKRLKRANIVDTPLERYENFIEKLLFNVVKDINKLIKELQGYSNSLEKMHDSLDKKMTILETSCDQLDFQEPSVLMNGSAFQPRLSDLVEFSHDGVSFSLGICSQVKFAICCVTFNQSECDYDQILKESFKISQPTERRIKEILNLTQFCNKNEL